MRAHIVRAQDTRMFEEFNSYGPVSVEPAVPPAACVAGDGGQSDQPAVDQ
jgi:hypothetical protein